MKRKFGLWLSALLVFNSASLVFGQEQSSFEQHLEQEREKVYHGGETQEEKEYYEKVAPQDIEKDRGYYQKSHPIKPQPLPSTPLEEAPLPENPIPENPIE